MSGSSSPWKTVFFVIVILLCLAGLIFMGVLFYRGYQQTFHPQNTTVIINSQTVNNPTIVKKYETTWLTWVLAVALIACVAYLIYLLIIQGSAKAVDFKTRCGQVFIELLGRGVRFRAEMDGEERFLDYAVIKTYPKDKLINLAMSYLTDGSRVYFMDNKINTMRYLYRFSLRQIGMEHHWTPDREPSLNNIFSLTVSAYGNVFDKVHFMPPGSPDEAENTMHKQKYGMETSTEPVEAASIIDLRQDELGRALQGQVKEEYTKGLSKKAVNE